MIVRVVDVRGMKEADRGSVCYVGRGGRYHTWPASEWGNYTFAACPHEYRAYLLGMDADKLAGMLERLWEACVHGEKALGCWCLSWDGTGETPGCHAAVWAELLNLRFNGGVKDARM